MPEQGQGQQAESGYSLPPGLKTFTLEEFEGINTKSTRPAIKDQQYSWIENLFPIGSGNQRTLFDQNTAIFTAGGGLAVLYFYHFNLATTGFIFVLLSDGSAIQVTLPTGATKTIATAGKFTTVSCASWGSQYLLILDAANGYYAWDGNNLSGTGTLSPNVQILNGGQGYTSAPTVTISGGSGSGATASATVTNGSVTKVTITNPGTGYSASDQPVIDFSGGGSGATAIATAALSNGSVSAITKVSGGTGYTSAPTVTISGGGGFGATATASASGGTVGTISVTAGGANYTSAPSVIFTGGGNTVAQAVVNIMPQGIVGTYIETFQSRVWLVNGSTAEFSAPNSIENFSTSSGGGSFTSTDSFLKSQFYAIKQANGYIYPFGDSSINVLSNIQTSGSPATTTFNNTNTDPEKGTTWPLTVQPYGRALVFLDHSGVYGLYGGSVTKVSDDLDGIIENADFSFIPSAAVANLFSIRCYIVLLKTKDTMSGTMRVVMAIWDGKKWFIGSQKSTLTFIATQQNNNQEAAWGTDGKNIFQMFAVANSTLTKKAQGKLWAGTGYIITKQVVNAYLEAEDNSGQGISLNVNIDTDTSSEPINLTGANALQFQSSNGNIFFTNSGGGTITFTVPGLAISGTGVNSVYGRLLGFSYNSTSADFTLVSLAMAYRDYSPFI